MKNQFFIFCSFCILFLFVSCGEKKVTEEVKDVVESAQTDTSSVSAQDTISLAKFQRWTNAWVQYGQAYTATTLIKYYTMPVVDLTQVLGQAPAAARYYQGLDTSVTPNVPHLLLVGVDANGNDMLDYNAGQYVYDVSRPCPPKCGK